MRQVSAQVIICFEAFNKEDIWVAFRDSSYKTILDECGKGVIEVPDSLPSGYAVLYGPRKIYNFYLMPGTRQSMKIHSNGHLDFNGAGKEINEYLNGKSINNPGLSYDQPEDEFLKQWEQMLVRLQDHLDSLSLPKTFKFVEHKRLHYWACNMLQAYPLYRARRLNTKWYAPKDDYYRRMERAMKEDMDAYELWEYRKAFENYIWSFAKKIAGNQPLEQLREALMHINQSVSDPRLTEYLVHAVMYQHVRNYGAEGVDKFLPVYEEKVRDSVRKADFDKLYQKHCRLAKGRKAPNFRLSDINGNWVSLSSLLGKYVFIDLWATWCMPCCKELPFMQQMEERYKGKPIQFIGISIDNDEAAWRRKVKADNLKGLQLHVDRESTFRDDYQISFIPRFMLINPEGKIVDVKLSRPSDPATMEFLDALLE
ncbi:TlpA family protein disulfide reductase [Bacteroides sp. AN502(2024)]|uniref:TlpA family protein disulfide reductase n=1 Tax=Bacteroides sp. AN502(2024) TaxID=3160599 RepID=UPI003511EE4B